MWAYDVIDHIMIDLKLVIGLVTMTFMAITNVYNLHQISIQWTQKSSMTSLSKN